MTRLRLSPELTGPLASMEDAFLAHLKALGYMSTGLSGQRALFVHLDRWLGAAGLGLADVTPSVLEGFLRARAAEGYKRKLTMLGLAPLVEHLEYLGLYTRVAGAGSAVDDVVGRFHRHLVNERGLG